MAEDREDASPGDKNSEEFEVLDEVGEVEGWDDDFLPDDFEEMETDDEQDLKVEEKAVDGQDTNADKKTLDRLDVKVEKNAVSEQDMKVDKKAVDQQDLKVVKDTVDQQDMKVNKKAVDQQDVKVSKKAVNDQDVKLDKKTVDQKGVKVEDMVVVNVCQNEIKLETKTENDSTVCKKPSNIGESNIASKENKEQSNKSLKEEASVGKHEKLVNELSVGSDTKLSDGSTGKDVKSSESTGGKIAKLVENSTAKDVKSESSATKDLKLSQSSTASDVKSCESTTAKDVKLAESSTARDAKLSERSTGKDVKPSENSTGKDAKSYESSTGKAKPSESSTGRDAKPSESSTGRNAKPSESSTGRDAKPSESLTGRDAKPSASSASKDVKSSASSTSKDVKPSAGSTGKDAKPSVSSTGKDAKPSAGSTGKDTKMYESLPAKDAKTSESLAAKDAKTSESSTGKDAKPPASSTGKDAKLPASSTGKDAKLSSQSSASKDKKSSDHSTTVKDAKLSNQSSSGKEAKHAEKDVSSTNKTSVDKKKAETRHSEPQKQTASCAPKRKSDDSGPQKPDEKKVKLSSEKTDHKTLKTLDEDVEYVSSSDPQKEHMIKKKHFVKTTINLSEEVKRNRDFRRWTEKYRKDGMVFPVFELQQPTELILFSRCQLISGYEDDSTKLCLGVKRNEDVLSFWACEQKFVPTIRKVVKAFEELVQSSGKPLFDPTSQQGYWQSIGVLANSKGQAVLQVHLHATDEREGEARFTEVKDILLATFDSKKAGLDVDISSIYLRLALGKKSRATERTTNSCIMGPGFISESIKGVTVKLYPWTYFSTGTSAMAALCEEMVKIMLRERCETVVEIGCGTGIIGQVLSKHCKMVLGVDTPAHVSDAKVNAQENKLTNCMYFDGKIKAALAAVSKEMRCNMSALVVVNALCYDMAEGPAVLEFLRRKEEVHYVAYVNSLKSFNKKMLGSLCTPIKVVRFRSSDHMPFLPLYVAPLDVGTKNYAAVAVLKHVKEDFFKELYVPREAYPSPCISVLHFENRKPLAGADAEEESRNICNMSPPTESDMLENRLADENSSCEESAKMSRERVRSRSPIRSRRDVIIGTECEFGDEDAQREADHTSRLAREVRMNRGGVRVTSVAEMPPRTCDDSVPTSNSRTVLQRQGGHLQAKSLQDTAGSASPEEVQDVETAVRARPACAEVQQVTSDRADELKQIAIDDDDGVNKVVDTVFVDSIFTYDIAPPGTEDLVRVMRKKREDVNIQARSPLGIGTKGARADSIERSKARTRAWQKSCLQSFLEGNRAPSKSVGSSSLRLRDGADTWSNARTCTGSNAHAPGGDRYDGNVWYKPPFIGDVHESFPLMKDVQFERRGGYFPHHRGTRDVNLCFHGLRPKVDDITSEVETDMRGMNTGRSGGSWKLRQAEALENTHDNFRKFDACRSSMSPPDVEDDYRHGLKSRLEFDESFPSTRWISDQCARSPSPKLRVVRDPRRENPYSSDCKPDFYGRPFKSSRHKWFRMKARRKCSSSVTGSESSTGNEIVRGRVVTSAEGERLVGAGKCTEGNDDVANYYSRSSDVHKHSFVNFRNFETVNRIRKEYVKGNECYVQGRRCFVDVGQSSQVYQENIQGLGMAQNVYSIPVLEVENSMENVKHTKSEYQAAVACECVAGDKKCVEFSHIRDVNKSNCHCRPPEITSGTRGAESSVSGLETGHPPGNLNSEWERTGQGSSDLYSPASALTNPSSQNRPVDPQGSQGNAREPYKRNLIVLSQHGVAQEGLGNVPGGSALHQGIRQKGARGWQGSAEKLYERNLITLS